MSDVSLLKIRQKIRFIIVYLNRFRILCFSKVHDSELIKRSMIELHIRLHYI
jgi:hypothetical protein